jgi:uncharacterized protein YcbK (DUF882 family)
MILKKGSNINLSKNFTENEFFSKSFNAPESHYFDEKLIIAAQLLRDTFNTPISVNSSFRTKEHNQRVGGAASSQHLKGNAVDLGFNSNPNSLLILQQDILNNGSIKKELRKMGINGFGLYDTFIHLDTRPTGSRNDDFGSFSFWDNRVTTKKKSQN